MVTKTKISPPVFKLEFCQWKLYLTSCLFAYNVHMQVFLLVMRMHNYPNFMHNTCKCKPDLFNILACGIWFDYNFLKINSYIRIYIKGSCDMKKDWSFQKLSCTAVFTMIWTFSTKLGIQISCIICYLLFQASRAKTECVLDQRTDR